MTARNAMTGVIRKICLCCQGGSPKFVRECGHVQCPLHSCRMIEDGEDAALQNCIAAFCLACAGSPEAVADCSADIPIGAQPPCPAHSFRMPEETPLPQLVRPLPGLGAACEQGAKSGSRKDGNFVGPDGMPQVPAALNQLRHEQLAAIIPGRAPEALDI
ncbi:hypothetical protein [Desulfomicrobium baculatum]|uniref:Uncharacterized protein n=1 Tax=Desulfomicrobium baculatum (strain DSM 4028 / VKM B-1378 / X) TaxID=525897 RepID=C7LU84_DESBD|nr:hypothetical protein [Desulfomicrobium baculatum]ACU90882.1 hypothetical protein Dbac_2806 [Desulfomicrobium baculatum DSM 4028]